VDVPRTAFIAPALPRLRSPAPTGDLLQRDGASSAIYGKNGGDLTRRFPRIAAAVLGLPTKSCMIDGEMIAAGCLL
jgi:hypothetical protein